MLKSLARGVPFFLLAFAACRGEIVGGADDPPPGAPESPSPPKPGAVGPAAPGASTPGAALPPGGTAVCDPSLKPSTPPRVRRLTAAQYEGSVRALLGKLPAGLANPFDDALGGSRFSTQVDAATIPHQNLSLLLDAAERIADEMSPALRSQFPCVTMALTQTCVESVISRVGSAAFRRPLTVEELGRYAGLVLAEQGAAGPDLALRVGVTALLGSPHFAFLWERGAGAPDAAGRLKLTPYEIAASLSYAITEGPPDTALQAAAKNGELVTAEQIRTQAMRLLGAGDRNSVRRFLQEYVGYADADAVFKDPQAYPYHRPEKLVDDTDQFVRQVIAARKAFLPALLTSTSGFARTDTARSYGVTVTSATAQSVTFPPGERAGILTQPSFLAAYSHPEANDPIRRGRFVSESLLCRPVPDLALPEIPEPPNLPGSTLRERLRAHSERPQCAGCHSLMDPLGFAFEQYDHTGRFRTMESGKPVDASGVLSDAGAKGAQDSVDGPFTGAAELAGRLARSPVVEACFTRHALEYWLGRKALAADGCTMKAAVDAYGRSGQDVVALFVELLSSESFLYRGGAR